MYSCALVPRVCFMLCVTELSPSFRMQCFQGFFPSARISFHLYGTKNIVYFILYIVVGGRGVEVYAFISSTI